jgi:hypothetical protein
VHIAHAIKTFDWILHVLKLLMVLTLLLMQNLKAEICVKVNFNLNYSFIRDSEKNNNEILKDQKSNTKYTFKLVK